MSLVIKMLNHPDYQRYIHTLEAHGYVYDILDIVTYIHRHEYDVPDGFWANKDDVNMREYNPFQSPRAESGATGPSGGRNTPVDVRKRFCLHTCHSTPPSTSPSPTEPTNPPHNTTTNLSNLLHHMKMIQRRHI
jgi:hypothetical protein